MRQKLRIDRYVPETDREGNPCAWRLFNIFPGEPEVWLIHINNVFILPDTMKRLLLLPVDILALDENEKLVRNCAARHETTAAADWEVWLDERQKLYLCTKHKDDLVEKTAERPV